jgi:iron complex outermembrane recepter protein
MRYSVLLAGASVAALCASGVEAMQQETGQTQTNATEVIQVTGSRVARTGFDAPTPTTVLGADDFERVAAPNLADVINQLPAARPSLTPSSSTNNTGVAGGNFLDLRGLGANRTLRILRRN